MYLQGISLVRRNSEWYHFDPLGTAGVITNSSASVISNNLYDVFGVLRYEQGSAQTPWRWTREGDEGLYSPDEYTPWLPERAFTPIRVPPPYDRHPTCVLFVERCVKTGSWDADPDCVENCQGCCHELCKTGFGAMTCEKKVCSKSNWRYPPRPPIPATDCGSPLPPRAPRTGNPIIWIVIRLVQAVNDLIF